jgi:hypothetical protein
MKCKSVLILGNHTKTDTRYATDAATRNTSVVRNGIQNGKHLVKQEKKDGFARRNVLTACAVGS